MKNHGKGKLFLTSTHCHNCIKAKVNILTSTHCHKRIAFRAKAHTLYFL